MPDLCKQCNRPKGAPFHLFKICDLVRLSNGRSVHAARVKTGGDLHDELGKDGLRVVSRNITPEMREQAEKLKRRNAA